MSNDLYTCPCCGYKTLSTNDHSSWDVCPICFWEDDLFQFKDPDFAGGANKQSLREGQKNFIQFGAMQKQYIENVRKPNQNDIKDSNFKLLE